MIVDVNEEMIDALLMEMIVVAVAAAVAVDEDKDKLIDAGDDKVNSPVKVVDTVVVVVVVAGNVSNIRPNIHNIWHVTDRLWCKPMRSMILSD